MGFKKLFLLFSWFIKLEFWILRNCLMRVRVRLFGEPEFKSPKFRGKIVLVTGAGQGLGKQIALQFSRQGAILALWDINDTLLRQTESEIKDDGGDVYAYQVDCSNKREVDSAARQLIKDTKGNVSVLVNNAAKLVAKGFMELTEEDIKSTVDVNILGYCWTTKAFLDIMKDDPSHGHIVNICSDAAYSAFPNASIYCASKAAVFNLTYGLNMEFLLSQRKDVSFTCVCPGRIDSTGMGAIELFPWPNTLGLSPKYVAEQVIHAVCNKIFFLDIPNGRMEAILRFLLPQHLNDELFLLRHHDQLVK